MDNKHIGSNFDDFLAEEALLEDATATAMKRVIAWQIEQEMKVQKLSKTAMATKMHTSRAALNRLLDATDTSSADSCWAKIRALALPRAPASARPRMGA